MKYLGINLRFYATAIKIPMASPPPADRKSIWQHKMLQYMAAQDASIYKKNIEMKITGRLIFSDF